MDDSISVRLADFAPLTRSYVTHLSTYLLRTQTHTAGRPPRDQGTVFERTERRFLEALNNLSSRVEAKRQDVYTLVDPAIQANELVPRWFTWTLTQHMSNKSVIYLQRLAEWRNAGLLPEKADGQFDPQYISCVFFARMIDTRKIGWLPRLSAVEPYACWRQDTPDTTPISYEIPIIAESLERTVIRRVFPIEDHPYVLYSPWQGVVWDDPEAWLVLEHGAIRWVGEVSNEEAVRWLKAHEHAALAGLPREEGISRRVLRILAHDRLVHKSSNDSHM